MTATMRPDPRPGDVLACGHAVPPRAPGSGIAGYAVRTASRVCICYACADVLERVDVAEHNDFTGYLSQDPSRGPRGLRLTTWTGGTLAIVTTWTESRRGGFSNAREIRFRARTPDGREWYGSGPGVGMYARVRARVGSRVEVAP